MGKVLLIQFPATWGLPNASPFCFKLEAWMQLQGIDYDVKYTSDPRKSPKGKLPTVVVDGKTVADSTLILEFLKTHFDTDPDARLSTRERGEAVAYQRLCDDHLYWCLVYGRWIDAPGWELMRPQLLKNLKAPWTWIFPPLVQRKVRGDLHAQGLGRHSRQQIFDFGCEDLSALAARVEGDAFFFGDAPATIDTVVLSTVANFLWTPLTNPMVEHARSLPSLDAYCRRVWTRCFPDRPLPELAQGL